MKKVTFDDFTVCQKPDEKGVRFYINSPDSAYSSQTQQISCRGYLMLHLKRFKFTEDLEMRKLNDPIIIFNELMVTSSQAEGRYSLVSVINHLGSTVNSGHYTSEGLHPDEALHNHSDRWLHYNDRDIFETSRAVVRE
ncbi:uncharacterized protein PAE49_009777 [Odontesthes bonariensis]